jgi:hypothetical protein
MNSQGFTTGRARRSQEGPGGARRGQGEPGGARGGCFCAIEPFTCHLPLCNPLALGVLEGARPCQVFRSKLCWFSKVIWMLLASPLAPPWLLLARPVSQLFLAPSCLLMAHPGSLLPPAPPPWLFPGSSWLHFQLPTTPVWPPPWLVLARPGYTWLILAHPGSF